MLALTDQLAGEHAHAGAGEARTHAARLKGEYERAYDTGVLHEREGRALLARSMIARRTALGGFRTAMDG